MLNYIPFGLFALPYGTRLRYLDYHFEFELMLTKVRRVVKSRAPDFGFSHVQTRPDHRIQCHQCVFTLFPRRSAVILCFPFMASSYGSPPLSIVISSSPKDIKSPRSVVGIQPSNHHSQFFPCCDGNATGRTTNQTGHNILLRFPPFPLINKRRNCFVL
ncbi:hypothetical protein BDN67DRAFT_272481 [Paxillus ammoniavirescens]|nr:hypothetical protein BDN67DRAFT_272481 [Paxillus ammoniavirescens]